MWLIEATGAFWLLQAAVCEWNYEKVLQVKLITAVFAAGIIVGIIAFKDDWATQAEKANHFLGG